MLNHFGIDTYVGLTLLEESHNIELDDTNYFKDSAGNHSSTVTLVRTNDSTKRERGKDRGRENLHSQKRSKATHDRQDEETVWSGEISEPQSPTFLE
jgi:hypothetical protein